MLFRFEIQKLLLNHLNFFSFLLMLDSCLVPLRRSHIGTNQVRVVRVTAEDALVMHDIEGFTVLLVVHIIVETFIVGVRVGRWSKLGLRFNDLGMSSLENLLLCVHINLK